MLNNFFFSKVVPFIRKLELGRPQMTIWLMRIAGWIPKAINYTLEYVILTALPLPQCPAVMSVF